MDIHSTQTLLPLPRRVQASSALYSVVAVDTRSVPSLAPEHLSGNGEEESKTIEEEPREMREIELPAVNVPRRCFGFCRRYGSQCWLVMILYVFISNRRYLSTKPTRLRTNLHEDGTGLLYVCVRERYVGGMECACICILHFVHISCVQSQNGVPVVYTP